MSKLEILAPAGAWDSLVAAVRCGANAVYLGTKTLNARKNAANFDDEELKNAVAYCHSHGVSVYVTLNTLIQDKEIETAIKVIERSCTVGVDALILQDSGLVKIVKEVAPDMPMHASTQMSVQTLYGIEQLREMGFCRAVIPRELSYGEIENLAKNSPLELEMFIHGALCMSVSGQCYMSAMLGGRSGNRGLCAQPCRLPFAVENGNGNDLSLKDLSIIKHIKELNEIGVKSFKIEGRMKRPEYVAAAVTACRQTVNGEDSKETEEALKAVFSRSGFTSGYYDGKLGKDMFGIRNKEDVVSAASVLKKLERFYDRENPLLEVDFAMTVLKDEPISLSAVSGGQAYFASSEIVPQQAISRPMTKENLEEQLRKCGGTQFFAGKIEIELDDGLNIPVSAINALRREALEGLGKKLERTNEKTFKPTDFSVQKHIAEKPKVYMRFSSASQIPENADIAEQIYLPLEECKKTDKIVGAEIPRGIFGNAEKIKNELTALKESGVKHTLCSTLDAVKIAKDADMTVHGGFGLNIFNSVSLEEYEKLGVEKSILSFEMTLQQISQLGGEMPRGVIVYGRVPLMLTRNCPQKNGKTCSECRKSGKLTDRMNIEFPIECTGYASDILNSRPIYMLDRLDEVKNIDYFVMYFTNESKQECEKIIDAYGKKIPPKGEFTRGLYYRGVE